METFEQQKDVRGSSKINTGLLINPESTFKLFDYHEIVGATLQNVSGRERAYRNRAQQQQLSGSLHQKGEAFRKTGVRKRRSKEILSDLHLKGTSSLW